MLKESDKALSVAIRPEVELLLCCARTCMDPERAQRIRTLLGEGIDWVYLIRTAIPHGMLPLLYWNLNIICPESVPKATLDQLRIQFDANTQRNLFLTRQLLEILGLLDADGIPALPFKGPVLAASVYGNLSLRQFCDLDILVQERHILRAGEILISHGNRPETALTHIKLASLLSRKNDLRFTSDDGLVKVELHWRLIGNRFFPINIEHLWERLIPVSLADSTVQSLQPEDLVLYLCVHGAKHFWRRLNWICDVAELVGNQQGMDWEQVIQESRRINRERHLVLGLLLANDLFGTELPWKIWQGVESHPVVRSLAAQVRKELFLEADSVDRVFGKPLIRGVAVSLESIKFQLSLKERLQDRLRYYLSLTYYILRLLRWGMTPNIKDKESLPLPGFLSFLYYILRPFRLIREYGPRVILNLIGRTDQHETHQSGVKITWPTRQKPSTKSQSTIQPSPKP